MLSFMTPPLSLGPFSREDTVYVVNLFLLISPLSLSLHSPSLPPPSLSPQLPATTDQAVAKLHELYYQGLFICNLLVEEKPDWIANKPDIVSVNTIIVVTELSHEGGREEGGREGGDTHDLTQPAELPQWFSW